MSWQAYIDQSLVGSGNVDLGLICDINDQTIWASSDGFSLSPEELKAIAESFKDASKVQEAGIKINGEKYMYVRSDDDSLTAKKGKEGVVAHKTEKAIVVAHHDSETQTTNAFSTVAELADYLKGVGY